MAKKKVKRTSPARETKAEKAAELRRQLARLEGSDEAGQDDGGDGDDEPQRGLAVSGGGAALERVLERGLSALGGLGRLLVEDTTEVKPGQEGAPVKFTRNAGHVRGVTLDGQGRVKTVDFQPEEWPPRREAF